MRVAEQEARGGRNEGIRRVVAQYALSGIGALILLGAAGVYLLERVGRREAIRNARQVAEVAGRGVAEPELTAAVLHGDATAVGRFDRIVRRGVLDGRVVRVKVWRPDGEIVYSDEHRLIGSRYPLGDDERRALATGKAKAEISDLSKRENRFERRFDKLLEVYLPISTTGGHKVLFEVYLRFSSVAANGRRIWTTFAPVLIGGLLLLYLVQVPLAWSMARGLRQGQLERERLLQRAIDASDTERRRIARDLHDGVVQSLAGVSYSLAAAADRLEGDGRPSADAVRLRQAAADTRQSMRDLRSLIVEISPPNLHEEGLGNALGDLLSSLSAAGVQTSLDVDRGLELAPDTEALVFRVAQEAVRNAGAHANAGQVALTLVADDGRTRLVVEDDGAGFSPRDLERRRTEGHVGLSLLSGLVADAGGTLEVDSKPGEGTRLTAEVPRR